ncbi:MAG: hypothetical protein ACI4XC_01950 [Eubacterium sp.]
MWLKEEVNKFGFGRLSLHADEKIGGLIINTFSRPLIAKQIRVYRCVTVANLWLPCVKGAVCVSRLRDCYNPSELPNGNPPPLTQGRLNSVRQIIISGRRRDLPLRKFISFRQVKLVFIDVNNVVDIS